MIALGAALSLVTCAIFASLFTRYIRKRLRTPGKWYVHPAAIFSALMFLPFSDLAVGYLFFSGYCSYDSGIEVYQRVGLGTEYFMNPGERQDDSVFVPYSSWKVAKGGELNLGKIYENSVKCMA